MSSQTTGSDKQLASRLDEAVATLRREFRDRDLADFGISDYSQRYLRESLHHDGIHLRVLADVLRVGLEGLAKPLDQLTVLDYGGGNGLLALLARRIGVGRVLYNDIFDTSCEDAARIAKTVGLEADDYIPGDLADVLTFLRQRAVSCDSVVSYDVIEHVYDIHPFLAELPGVGTGPLRIAMASAANDLNPRRRRQLMQTQRLLEEVDREPEPGHKERDTLRAYVNLRRDMIIEYAPDLDARTSGALAAATRGMAGKDITDAVDEFRRSGRMPQPDHPTNTCDPSSGNWAEHLMDPYALARTLQGAGMRGWVQAGRYGYDSGARGLAATVLNGVISVTGRAGLRLAPYYLLVGERA